MKNDLFAQLSINFFPFFFFGCTSRRIIISLFQFGLSWQNFIGLWKDGARQDQKFSVTDFTNKVVNFQLHWCRICFMQIIYNGVFIFIKLMAAMIPMVLVEIKSQKNGRWMAQAQGESECGDQVAVQLYWFEWSCMTFTTIRYMKTVDLAKIDYRKETNWRRCCWQRANSATSTKNSCIVSLESNLHHEEPREPVRRTYVCIIRIGRETCDGNIGTSHVMHPALYWTPW